MTRVLLTGATGMLGQELLPRLQDAGNEVRATSREPPGDAAADEWAALDLASGTGVETAIDGVDVVVHAASDARGDSEDVDVRGTERLLDAAATAGVSNFVYVSIVGIEDVPYSYYQHKLAAEDRIQRSAVPATIVRATQFHGFVDLLLGLVARLPLWPLPTDFRIQPVDEGEVADAVVGHATEEPAGRVSAVGGPAVRSVRDLATAYREARGLRRPIVRLPLPGQSAAAARAGALTCPDRAVGTRTFEDWLEERY